MNVLFQSSVFLAFVVITALANKVLLAWLKRMGVNFNRKLNGSIRWHNSNKPLIGGMTFALALLLSTFFAILLNYFYPAILSAFYKKEVLSLLIVGGLAIAMGLADDIYGTRPWLKFSVQLLCGTVLWFLGPRIELFPWQSLNLFLTLLWTVGIMNSLNMLDNMDGVAGSLALIITIYAFYLEVLLYKSPLWELWLLAMAGALVGFLLWNYPPAKLYMGDGGSQLLGAWLVYLGLRYFWKPLHPPTSLWESTQHAFVAVLPYVMLITDTTLVFIGRLRRKQSPFVGGKDHITHVLAYSDIPETWVPLWLTLFTFIAMIVHSVLVPKASWSAIITFLTIFLFHAYLYHKRYRLIVIKHYRHRLQKHG